MKYVAPSLIIVFVGYVEPRKRLFERLGLHGSVGMIISDPRAVADRAGR
jgi:hypothetical protein